MDLTSNDLSGSIPDMGALTKLINLYLGNNQFTGPFPASLARIPNLDSLYLVGSQLSGCMPASLRSVRNNDLDSLGLLYCDQPTLTATAHANRNGHAHANRNGHTNRDADAYGHTT